MKNLTNRDVSKSQTILEMPKNLAFCPLTVTSKNVVLSSEVIRDTKAQVQYQIPIQIRFVLCSIKIGLCTPTTNSCTQKAHWICFLINFKRYYFSKKYFYNTAPPSTSALTGRLLMSYAMPQKSNVNTTSWLAAIAPWFCLRLPSCGPDFESKAHHLCFFQFVLKL